MSACYTFMMCMHVRNIMCVAVIYRCHVYLLETDIKLADGTEVVLTSTHRRDHNKTLMSAPELCLICTANKELSFDVFCNVDACLYECLCICMCVCAC